MAKNEWGDTPVEVEDPRSWGDRPAEQVDLPAGVKPSTAGAGRGNMSLADYRRAEAQRTPQESGAGFHVPGVIDPLGLGGGRPELGGVAVETRERPVSVLQTQGMAPPDPGRRLSMGAGPISQGTAARAERMVDGEDPGQDNRNTVIRAARGLSDQVARGEASTMGDLVRRAKSPTAQRLATQRQAEEVRNVGEWAVDSTSALLSGAVSLVELPTNIVAPGSSLAGKLGEWQQGLRELESPQMSARREQLADRVRNEDGFIDQYLATVAELVTNPSVAVHETLRQAAMFGGVLAAARGGQMLAQGAVAVGSRLSPTLALGEAISGGSIAAGAGQAGATLGGVAASTVMAAGDAAGNAFKHLMAQPQRAWDANEEYQQLIAEGVDPLKAKEDIATSKARLAAVIAAPLGLLGFMGAEASFVGSMAVRAGRVASRQPARVLATELITEPAEEALTQMAGNAAVRTVDAGQSLTEGAGEAAGMATVTSGPFAAAGAVNELRKPIDRSEQIKALRAAGDTTAAEMLQRRFDRESAAYNAGTEAQRLQGFGAEVADRYRSIRAAGAKSGEAVVRTAIEAAAARASDEAGLSPKARAALMEGLQTIPPEKAPQAIQRFVENMAAAGAAQPFDGLDNLAQQTEADMEGMLDAVLDDSVRPTMDAIEQLEDQTQAPAPDAQQADLSVPVDDADFDAGNDVLVTPETDAVHAAATSPLNDLPEPTQAQKDAGNYKVGRIRLAGMDVSVENPQGSVRRGTSPDGTAWETPMRDHYGYIRGTTAADGDKLDVFIKPGTPPDFDGMVFVVDQVDPDTGKFDEAKVVMGAADQAEAEAIYLRNYSDGWQGLGAITALPMAEFKAWATSDRTRMPLADLPNQGPAAVSAPVAAQLYGQDGTPIAEGGRPFKTRRQADQARRLQSGMRVVSAEGGYALTEKTEAQIRAQERAAQRLRNADTGAGPISAHGHIAARGGMAKSTMGDLGFDRNVRVGNRWLFAATGGMSLDQAAQSLKQAGYLNDETEASAAAVISRSVRNPVYTPEGIEAIAEEQARQQFEEHLREQQEADDPFGPIDDFTDDELAAAGYAAASDDIKAQVAALLAQAEAMGLDAEGLLEDAARATTDQPEQAYYDQAQRSLEEAIGESARSRGDDELGQDGQEQPGKARPAGGEDRGQADGGQGEAGRVTGDQLLESPSREQVLQQQDRRDSAAARDDRDQIRRESDVGASQFTLTGEDGRQDTTASLFAMEPGDGYSRPYETDLFGEALPESTRAAAKAAGAARVRRDVQPTAAVPGDTPATPGEYFVRTAVGTEVTRKLGASRINSFADLAQATQYLYRSAVERLDAIVTDANGKPLAVVGGFKGAVNQTSVYPGTLVGEAVRVPGAARIWFSHNHPSGTAQLSRADETLNQSLTNVFRGSGIEPMGLIAVAGKKYADSESGVGSVRPAEGSTEVPVIERDLIAANAVSDIIDSPITAKSIARAFYGRANAPGIMLLDSQNRVSAWIPIPQDMRGHLRYGAGLNAIYRAVSESNAVSAIIAHGGELDETPFDRKDVTSAQNIMAALKQVDVRPLDTIDVKTGRSQAELGYLIDAGPVFARAYHGTPHRGIDRFSTEKVGTGEGAQAYGWGLYFASQRAVAEHYRKGLSYREIVREFREEMPDDADFEEALDAADTMSPYRARVIRALAAEDWLGFDYPAQAITAAFRDLENYDVSQELQDAVRAAQGQLYQVSVPEDGDLLLWDSPLSEQPDGVRKALESDGWKSQSSTGQFIYTRLSDLEGSDKAASERLAGLGIKGIKYLDGSSRRAGDGSYNYVIFSGDDVAIEEALYRRDDDMNGQGLVITADLFRRMTTPVRYGMTVAELRSVVDPVVRSWANPPEIVVVDTAADLPMAAPSDAAGAYFQGTVYLVASRMRTPQKALQFLGHEAIAHYGLREMLGPDGWKSMMANIQLALKAGNVELGKLQAEVRQAYTDSDGKFRLSAETEADEIAARAVEMAVGPDGKFRPGFGFFKAVYAKIAEFLRGLGIKVAFTNTELQGMLVNAQRFLQVGQRTAGAGPAARPVWARGDVIRMPQVVIGSNLGAATSHPKYEAAKGGDVEAAVEVAKSLVTPQLIRQVRAEIGGAKPMVVPVVSVESSGRNKIPLAAAEVLAAELGLDTADGITQSNRPRRTALGGLDRIFARVEFDGPVTPGQDYLLLDDTLTQGGTFAALASHIEAGGGRVVGAVALTGKQYSAKIEPSTETIKALRDKHGDLEPAFKAATGYGFDALTESEARYLANFRPADAVRTRILAARDQAGKGADSPDAGPHVDGPVFARSPTLRAPAQPAATTQETGDQDLPGASPAGEPASPEPDFWAVPQDTWGDRIVYELQDGRVDLKRVQQAITATRGQIDERFDARLAETLYPGRVARRSEKFLEDEAQPLLQVMARNNVTMDELSDFLHARHARERNEQIAKINPDMPDGGAGKNSKGELMTTVAAEAYLAGISSLRRLVLDNLAARVDAITTGTRKLLVDEGLEKAETVKAWEGAYKAYVPLFRDEAEGGNPHHAGTGISVRGSASRRAMGSTKQATNILAHVLMQREAAITRAEKNRVGVALYGLALQAPNTDFWTTIRPSMSDAEIGAELRRMGVPEAAADGMTRAPTIRTVDPVLGRVIERPNPMYKSMPGAIVVKVNGSDRVLMFDTNDVRGARMAESLKNLDGLTRLDIAGSVVGKATRWLAAVNTQYNPAFGLVNFVRDSIGGSVNITSTALRGKASKVLAMTPAAVAGIARELAGRPSGEWGKLFRQFQADGGQTGYREMFKDADARTKAIEAELKSLEKAGKLRGDRVVGAILGALDVFNTTLENAVRLAAYREALGAGMSRAESARLARELTVDFNRKGRTGREFGPLYAFFNASVQGSARTLQTLAGPAGAKIISAGLMLGVAQAVLLLLAGYDDDDIPEFVKSRALIVPLGESEKGEKRYFALPLPLGLHVLPNTGRVLAELTLSGGQDLGAKAFDAVGEIAGSFNPLGGGNVFTADGLLKTIAPTVLDPFIEWSKNKNYAGMPIEREAAENDPRPGFQRARESTMRSATGQAYIELSRILNTATGGDAYEAGLASPTPEFIRHFMQVLGGGLLREAEKIVNTAVDVSNGEDVKSRGVPVLGRFFGEVDDELVQRSRYFDNVREIERAERRLKAAEKAGDTAAANEIEKDEPILGALRTKRNVAKELRDLNADAIESLGTYEETRQIDADRTAAMKELNTEVDEILREANGPTPGDRLREAVRPSTASPP
jgi:hypothetical protein